MVTLSTHLLLLLALSGVGRAPLWAQEHHLAPQPGDSLLLSETIQGDTRLQRYRVAQRAERVYRLLYRINGDKLLKGFDANSSELQELDRLLQQPLSDSTSRLVKISVTGYSSPDGPHTFNVWLAKARTTHLLPCIEQKLRPEQRHLVEHHSVAEDWASCRPMVAQATLADRDAVLRIIDDATLSHDQKEAKLKELPAAWEYLKREVLPHLRRVEVVVTCDQDRLVEVRTPIVPPKPAAPKPEPEPEPQPQSPGDPCGECEVVDESITGFIVEYPAAR